MSVEQTSMNQLITDNIDVWTSTVKTKSASGRGSSKKRELYGVKKLRELILELAVRGKLVPQDPNDEPASVLVELADKAKERLAEQKIIRKQKPLALIDNEQMPFILPKNWTYHRLGSLGLVGSSSRVQKKDWTDNGVPFYRAREIVRLSKNGFVENELFISEELFSQLSQSGIIPEENDIMFTGVGTIGVPHVVKAQERFYFKDASVLIFKNIAGVNADYLSMYMRSPLWNRDIHEDSMGTTVHTLTIARANNVVTPFPPIKEQHRIVAKVDELMTLCDQLEQQTEASIEAHQVLVTTLLDTLTNSVDADELMQNWARISEHFDTLFTTEASIDQLKQTILQLAVMGKLVPQDPNDEPAAKLLECIAEEKAQLIKDKKIKKQKALPPISDDEKPFELPKGWEWERIGNLSHFIEYGSSQKTVESLPNGVPVLKMGDIQNGKLILGEHKVMSSDVDELPNLYVKNNDVLYNRTNSAELVGKTGIYKGEDDKYSFASYLIRIRCNSANISPDYLNLSMNTPLFRQYQIEPHIKKQCGQANVNGTLMKSMLVSVPPLDEQVLIFNKVNELHKLCDQLKARVIESKVTQLRLTDSIVEQAV
ncbi:restriction endonuclease subunit S [Vibrio crassostreae]|uniref:restriction endonuclease subunit S n=1 Tax=Vibrio crassostreae TaxID=246167 RepID=UPI000634EDA5|nr:restriction endonuclease subunit S [Vibrio crassostreae]TCO03163.1 type I restriction enzyme S subunit [Vibrio crassostreae]CAK1734669.1 type I restriction enzyme, S subunit [Vibrio crassostreae]CAK1735607.1 type I restriction enzyme, S subunit [Vibrio crassostreae]CAK1735668.1 type I restriction enzyme, S subunit [Vibrio crassostreae]CAK2136376.1 type I restriction enzyme, S subunit [Vibrio crassostreae]